KARRLYDRVDWASWSSGGLVHHGSARDGALLRARWDRLNGETVLLYVLAGGAEDGRGLGRSSWLALRPFYGTVAGRRFNNADLGLFVFQYGLDLLDPCAWQAPGSVDLWAEARGATLANEDAGRAVADDFITYRRFWGLSAGDGPGRRGGR